MILSCISWKITVILIVDFLKEKEFKTVAVFKMNQLIFMTVFNEEVAITSVLLKNKFVMFQNFFFVHIDFLLGP